MAQKRSPSKKRRTAKGKSKYTKSGGFSIGKFTLGLFILLGLGYAALAIWEGKLVPDEFSEFEIPDFSLDSDEEQPDQEEQDPSQKETERPETPSPSPVEEIDLNSFDLYFTKAFDFAWPKYQANEAIIERPYYTIRYQAAHKQAIWAAYALSADSLQQESLTVAPQYRKDPRVKSGPAEVSDYKAAPYIMGQLAPSDDFAYDDFALSQSYYISNTSPQKASFNQGPWRQLEKQVRKWAKQNEKIYVVSGPVLTSQLQTIGKNKVSVPNYFYKIVVDMQAPEIKAIGFLLKNEGSQAPLKSFVVPIDRIEQVTGLDFFPAMPEKMANYLKSGATEDSWDF